MGWPMFSDQTVWLFDLDDTLYAPQTGFAKAMGLVQHQALANQLNVTVTEVKPILTGLVEQYGGAPFTGLHKTKMIDMDRFIEEGFDLNYSSLKPDLDVLAYLKVLPGRKVVFTNSPQCHAQKVLKALGLNSVFDEADIFDVVRLNFESKPKKSAFEFVLAELAVAPENCVMIEDSLSNLKVAKDYGMTTVSVYAEGQKPPYVDFAHTDLKSFLSNVSACV